MLTQPFVGFAALLAGLRLLLRPALWPYVIIPLLINTLIFGGLLWFAAGEFGGWVDHMVPTLPHWLAWLSWLLWLLFALVAGIVVFFTFSMVANIIGSPFNGLLAEAVERMLTGQEPPASGSLGQALREAPKAIMDELRKIGYFLLWAIPLLILFVIPGLNLAAPFLWALFSAWMLALEYADYPLGNHSMAFSDQRKLLRSKTLLAMGFGGTTMLATMIPLLNLIVMPAAVAGATKLWVEQLRPLAHSSKT